jgi:hypothetical protein
MKRVAAYLGTIAMMLAMAQPVMAESDIGDFRVRLTNGERWEGREGVLTDEGLDGIASDGRPIFVPRERIAAVARCRGSMGVRGAIIGAAAGFCLAKIADLKADDEGETEDPQQDSNESVILITLGGALAGAIIGTATRKWEAVPIETSIGFSPEDGAISLALKLTF